MDADQSFMIDRTDTTLDLSYISRELLKKEGVYSGREAPCARGETNFKFCCLYDNTIYYGVALAVVVNGHQRRKSF